MLIFQELGAHIDRTWEAADFNERDFPRIAAEALVHARIPEKMTGDDVLQWVLGASTLPAQEDLRASFGQPPITIYRGRRFHIQVLYWLDGSTTIHKHGFCGAFQVFEGGSLHSRWTFATQRRVTARILLGQTKMLGSEWLSRGQVIEITTDLTHGLFHLEAPSVTIVVRTDGDTADGPQYEYHPPTIAVDPFFIDPLVERQLQVLHLLRASGNRTWEERVTNLLARTDVHTVFRVLLHFARDGVTLEQLEQFAHVARVRHGTAIDAIVAALRETSRRRAIHVLRRQIREPEGRLFLALLQNLPNRDATYQALCLRYPDSAPEDVLNRLVTTYASRLGIDIGDDLERILVEALLVDAPEEVIFDKLRAVFDDDSIATQRDAVLAQRERIRESILAPIFVRGVA